MLHCAVVCIAGIALLYCVTGWLHCAALCYGALCCRVCTVLAVACNSTMRATFTMEAGPTAYAGNCSLLGT